MERRRYRQTDRQTESTTPRLGEESIILVVHRNSENL